MKILHTSDWHLGRMFYERSREEEQRQALFQVVEHARRHRPHLFLLAGDVYDTYNPPTWAEALFYQTLSSLSECCGMIAVIAGNHDSPQRILAAQDLAFKHRVVLLGLPGDVPRGQGVAEAGENWARLCIEGLDHDVVLAALPYPSEGRMGISLSGEDVGQAYSARILETVERAAAHFREDAVNIIMSHLFAQGGAVGDSERGIQGLGGALKVDVSAFPQAGYIALGHLHRAQAVGGRARYSGALMAHDFSENQAARQIVLAEAEPGRQAEITPLPITAGRPLVRIAARDMEEALARIEGGEGAQGYIEVVLESGGVISQAQAQSLSKAHPRVVSLVRAGSMEGAMSPASPARGLTPAALFEAFYRERNGRDPDPEVARLFVSLLSDEDGEIGL